MKILLSKSTSANAVLLLLIAVLNTLLSPKWFITPALWLVGVVAVRYFRNVNWKGYLVAWLVLSVSSFIAQYEVVPMPVEALIPFMIIANALSLIPLILDRWLYQKFSGVFSTLVYPLAATLFAYLADQGPAGTWGNPIYTQYHFTSFIQLVSITGIYGIYFIITWFASLVNYGIEKISMNEKPYLVISSYTLLLLAVVFYGHSRLSATADHDTAATSVSTVVLDNIEIMKAMYDRSFNENITLKKGLSASSPEIAALQRGLVTFMGDPENPKYKDVYTAMDNVLDKYLEASKQAVHKGAKIISWPEGAITNVKAREKMYKNKVAAFADRHDVYLFFSTAVFHPEKVGKEDKFIENKVLTFDPNGHLINEYFKNIPVFGIEPSFPGDGSIPLIKTAYGDLGSAICYDLDFPELIRQAGQKELDLLVVPTGDWKAIAPYHTYMGAFRCIENGTNMLKAVNNGLSAVIDNRGRLLSTSSFFDEEDVHTVDYRLPLASTSTLYSKYGDYVIVVFSFLSLSMLSYLLIWKIALPRIRMFKYVSG